MGFQWGSIDRVSLFVVALIALITFLAFFPLVKVVVFALSLAVVLIPAQEYLSRRITPALSAFFLTSGVVLLGFSAVVFTFSVLYDNMDYLIGIISSILEGLQPSLMAELPVEIDTLGLDDMINNLLLSIQDAIYVYLSMIPGAAVQLLLFILSLSILIYSGPGIKADVNRMIPAGLPRQYPGYLAAGV